jgi:hypothetical protein
LSKSNQKNEGMRRRVAAMRKHELIGKVFGIALVCLLIAPILGNSSVMAQSSFTGDVEADFTGPGVLVIPDPSGVGDVGLPLNAPPGTVSGWDMVDLRLTYNNVTDTLYVGINTFGIAGDADGDGNPSETSAWLANYQGTDNPDLGGTESVAVYFDLNQDGTFDVIAGVPGTANIADFTVASFSGFPGSPASAFGTPLPTHTGSYHANPTAADPDFEFTILDFSTLPGQDALLAGFIVSAFMGSLEDDGIGEDYIQYDQSPSTITGIASSVGKVVAGGSVNLTVTEHNDGDADLASPRVVVTKADGPSVTLEWPPATGDDADPGVLNVDETWNWTISLVPITATTTFAATGSGVAPGGFLVTYPGDLRERDDVVVNTDGTSKLRTPLPWIVSGVILAGGISWYILRRRKVQR